MDVSRFYFLRSSHLMPSALQYSRHMTFPAFVTTYLMIPCGKGHGTPYSGLKTYGLSLFIGHPRLAIGSSVPPFFPIANSTSLIAWPRRNHGKLMYRCVDLVVHATMLTMQVIECYKANHTTSEHCQQEISRSSGT